MSRMEITRESVIKAVADGAKNVSQVAIAHGYAKPVSGGVTAKIRQVVPEVAQLLMAGVSEEVTEPIAVVDVVEPVVEPVKVEVVEPVVEPVKAVKVGEPAIVIPQRKSPYGGKLYGAVYAEALAAGRVEFRTFVEVTAKKLHLTEQQVFVAANVMRIAKHRSNGHRSKDIAGQRGVMHLVPVENTTLAG